MLTMVLVSFRESYQAVVVMITRSNLIIVICCTFLITTETLIPKTLAIKRAGLNEFMTRDQRTRKMQNYIEESPLDNDLFENVDDIGPPYQIKPFKPDETTEELPSFIVDYANMIRNDIILLDNSVETRTRKRGNIKVEKHNQAIPDTSCSCELSNETEDLGENTYPRYIENRTCSNNMCRDDYSCISKVYHLTVLKRRTSPGQVSRIELPNDLRHQWIAEKTPVIIGCMCTRDYIIEK